MKHYKPSPLPLSMDDCNGRLEHKLMDFEDVQKVNEELKLFNPNCLDFARMCRVTSSCGNCDYSRKVNNQNYCCNQQLLRDLDNEKYLHWVD